MKTKFYIVSGVDSWNHYLKYFKRKVDDCVYFRTWLYQICRGIELECVIPRFYSKSIGCCKRFPGKNAITGFNTLKHWITQLVTEIVERLEKDIEENNRQARQSVISFTLEINGEDVAQTRSTPITSTDQESLEKLMMEVLRKNIDPFFKKDETAGLLNFPIKYLGITAGKFLTMSKNTVTLQTMFAKQALKASTHENDGAALKPDDISFAPGSSSTQIPNESKIVKEKPLEKLFEKQSQMFKEKPKTIPPPERKPSFFKQFFMKSKNEETTNSEVEDLASKVVTEDLATKVVPEDVSDPKEKQDIDEVKMKVLEDWFVNDDELETQNPPAYKNEAEKKALEKLYEIQASITDNEIIDLEKEKDTLERLMKIKDYKYKDDIPEIIEETTHGTTMKTVNCEKCGKDIVNYEKAIQSHKDFHTAMDLSREQREEFRQETRNKQNPPAKKVKLDSTVLSIQSFFEHKEASTVEQQPCDECGRLIDVEKLAEHADYHFARKIQIQMNSNDIKMVSKTKKTQQGKAKDSKSAPSVAAFFSQPSTSKTSTR